MGVGLAPLSLPLPCQPFFVVRCAPRLPPPSDTASTHPGTVRVPPCGTFPPSNSIWLPHALLALPSGLLCHVLPKAVPARQFSGCGCTSLAPRLPALWSMWQAAFLKFLQTKREASVAEVEAVFNDIKESRWVAAVVAVCVFFWQLQPPLPPCGRPQTWAVHCWAPCRLNDDMFSRDEVETILSALGLGVKVGHPALGTVRGLGCGVVGVVPRSTGFFFC